MQQIHLIYIILAIVFMCYGLHACSAREARESRESRESREGFAALSPGPFPSPSLLPNSKRPGGLSNLTSRDLKPYYPVFDHGYGQYTNNVRYWATPNNGKCTPPEFCGGLYNNNQSIHIAPVPRPLSLHSDVRRVNFYGSDTMTCPDTPPQDVANCLYYGHKTNSLVPPYEPTLL